MSTLAAHHAGLLPGAVLRRMAAVADGERLLWVELRLSTIKALAFRLDGR